MCSIINATDHDSDGKCSSSVVVLIYHPLGGPCMFNQYNLS